MYSFISKVNIKSNTLHNSNQVPISTIVIVVSWPSLVYTQSVKPHKGFWPELVQHHLLSNPLMVWQLYQFYFSRLHYLLSSQFFNHLTSNCRTTPHIVIPHKYYLFYYGNQPYSTPSNMITHSFHKYIISTLIPDLTSNQYTTCQWFTKGTKHELSYKWEQMEWSDKNQIGTKYAQ